SARTDLPGHQDLGNILIMLDFLSICRLGPEFGYDQGDRFVPLRLLMTLGLSHNDGGKRGMGTMDDAATLLQNESAKHRNKLKDRTVEGTLSPSVTLWNRARQPNIESFEGRYCIRNCHGDNLLKSDARRGKSS